MDGRRCIYWMVYIGIKMNNKKIQVNMCYEVNKKRNCITLSKEEAYLLKDQILKLKGTVYWFNALDI